MAGGIRFRTALRQYGTIADHADFDITGPLQASLSFRLNRWPGPGEVFGLLSKGGYDVSQATNFGVWIENGVSDSGAYLYAGFRRVGVAIPGATAVRLFLPAWRGNFGLSDDAWHSVSLKIDTATGFIEVQVRQRDSAGYRPGPDLLAAGSAPPPTATGWADTGYSVGSLLSYSSSPAANAAALLVGATLDAAGTGVTNFLDGSVTEVAVYSGLVDAISSATVLGSRYGERLTGFESGLRGYWRMDEGTGSTCYDRTRRGHDMTLVNAPEWSEAPVDLLYPAPRGARRGFLGVSCATFRPLASIACSDESADASYAADNLLSPIRGRTSRTAGVAGAKRWTLDAGDPVPTWYVAILNHNFTSAATILLEADDEATFTSPPVSVDVTYHPGDIYVPLARPWQYRHWRLSVTDAANPDGYLEVGHLGPWDGWPFPARHRRPDATTVVDPSTSIKVRHGDRVTRHLATSQDIAVDFKEIARAHALWLREEAVHVLGVGAPCLLVPDPLRGLYQDTRYGTLAALPEESIADVAWDAEDAGPLALVEDRA